MIDLISRQAVLDILSLRNSVWDAYSKVVDLPSAQPERKTGRWIIDRAFGNDILSNEQMVICSECGKGSFYGKQNYCPNCGADMREAEDE